MITGHLAGRLGALCLLALLTACAAPPISEETAAALQALPPRQMLSQVPFFPQQRYQCGPAALASMLGWSGVSVAADTLSDEIYIPHLQGSLQVEILAASRRHGRIAYRIPPRIDALLTELAAGHPVLVLQNLGLDWAPRWHYAVAIGYDLPANEIILHSGREARHRTSIDTFRRTWARSQRWAIVVLAPQRLPATATADAYLRAVLALERQKKWQAAQRAYASALSRWPDNLIALMGAGNTAYHLRDLPAAEAAFRRTLQYHPQAAAAHNNLALTLLALGRPDEAEQHARQAIELSSGNREEFLDTLARIERAQVGN